MIVNSINEKILECQLDTPKFLTALFNWQKGTEDLLSQVAQKFDTNGYANIIPSLDLGLPNNIGRISGGFLTGSYIEWNCKEPIIPIDTTVNVCSSSVYMLDNDISDISIENFTNSIENAKSKLSNYSWNFASGNHFIILAKEDNKCYLVLHSSASEFKKQLDVGLYPTKNNWYWNDIERHTIGSRYIRYIKGKKAEKFAEIALKIPDFNTIRHRHFADELMNGFCKVEQGYSKHHYGMPNTQSVNIGCFLSSINEKVPIFSAQGKKIFIYETHENDPQIGNKKLIPHGWGKTNKDVDDLQISSDLKYLLIAKNKYSIDSEERLKGNIRDLSDNDNDSKYYFNLASAYLKGKVKQSLTQLIAYSASGITDWRINNEQ